VFPQIVCPFDLCVCTPLLLELKGVKHYCISIPFLAIPCDCINDSLLLNLTKLELGIKVIL